MLGSEKLGDMECDAAIKSSPRSRTFTLEPEVDVFLLVGVASP